jgi:two-component system NtrC family sensor kinase
MILGDFKLPGFLGAKSEESGDGTEASLPYRRLWKTSVILTALVSLVPLIFMTVINIFQYQRALTAEMEHPTTLLLSNNKRSLEFFIAERLSALRLVVRTHTADQLCDQQNLERVFRNVNDSFSGFVDLGLITADGTQCSYVGPYRLQGKNYHDADWFHEVTARGEYVSDVFMGYRDVPHFAIAVRHEDAAGRLIVLRATVGADLLAQYAISLDLKPTSDAFIVNSRGILQTPSRSHGEFLKKATVPVPPYRSESQVTEQVDTDGRRYMLGYAYIDRSPFVLMVVKRPEDILGKWLTLRGDLLGFLAVSAVLILIVILWSSTAMVNQLKEADKKRAQILHNIEYTSKMASIGRLAAGVAHEINNPLAIINEKAGLLTDLVEMSGEFPRRGEVLEIVRSIEKSVERCSTITHRLLGFAKRMDLRTESIRLEELLKEVLGFLGKEANYRNITVEFHVQEGVPAIESDRGQLQQVFLNIINNAFAAVEDGGRVDLFVERAGDHEVAVKIQDNGHGISKENLKHIFEPFFTTKKEYGTGLGLSITYGIVEKLGGRIEVESEVGRGTTFTVRLPVPATKF